MPDSFHGATRIAVIGACVAAACLQARAEPPPPNEFLSESARVRLRAVDLRIEVAAPGSREMRYLLSWLGLSVAFLVLFMIAWRLFFVSEEKIIERMI